MRIFLLLLITLGLGACSTTPQVIAEKPQYCNTQQEIKLQNGTTVNSETTISCNDDMMARLFQVKSGLAPNCGVYTYWMKKGGHDVQRRGVSCQKPDGTWEIVNTGINY